MSFQRRLASGKFVVLAEMNTPKGVNVSELVANSRSIKGRVDAIIIPDMDDGVMRMSALAGGALIHQQGMEAIIHVYCRDRNRMALQGDILAAHVLGIRNLVVVPGEEIANGDHRDAHAGGAIWTNWTLIGAIQSLAEWRWIWRDFPSMAVRNLLSGAPWAALRDDQALDEELAELEKKWRLAPRIRCHPAGVRCGAICLLVLEKIAALDVPVIATVFLIKSVGIARYMALNEPGAAYFRRNDQTHPQSPRQRIGMPEDRRGDHCRT
jgi:methylenetetrahydrofolate reductase (NADPH)